MYVVHLNAEYLIYEQWDFVEQRPKYDGKCVTKYIYVYLNGSADLVTLAVTALEKCTFI